MGWPVSSIKKSPLVVHPGAKNTPRGGSFSMHVENSEVVPGMDMEVAKAGIQTFILLGEKPDPNGRKSCLGQSSPRHGH